MRIVIESASPERSRELTFFFPHFTLPLQLCASSLTPRKRLSPRFYVQCVTAQRTNRIKEFLLRMAKQVTWVRLTDGTHLI
jgi:hypothetical protein